MIDKTHLWEQGIVQLLNLDGWELEWCGGSYEHYDAIGKTPKGFDCIIEFKLRSAYYLTKVLEVYKFEKLMSEPKQHKFYYVFDSKGNYLYHLNTLKLPEIETLIASSTTYFENTNKINKPVYMLSESQASILVKY